MVGYDNSYHNSTYSGAGSRRWKGKARAETVEGSGGRDGTVIPLTMTGSGYQDVAFTVPVLFGGSKELLLHVDTGSSDLWVVSTSCSSKLCKQAGGQIYDPSSSRSTGRDFEINYLLGKVKGPVVWDSVELGGYAIGSQALAAATEVSDEPISPSFSGLLGLALPGNSVITSLLGSTTSDDPDGAALPANLFGITPPEKAPGARFYSLSLSRPDSKFPSALLGIGRHPSEFVSSDEDEARIQYVSLIPDRGTLFWKTNVHDISVWNNGEQHTIQLGSSANGAVFPTAVIDSGVPVILTSSKIANAIYGAINIQPASDGQYYLPCSTPLNITVSFENGLVVPLHPLDLTANPPQKATDTSCIGLIQAADGFVGTRTSMGDMILGVPFMRSVYTVMAYTQPDSEGAFEDTAHRVPLRPALGMLPLTDSAKALDEFNTIRVLNRPLEGGPNPGNRGSAAASTKSGINVGVAAAIGISAFAVLCVVLFGVRWFLARRQWKRQDQEAEVYEKSFLGSMPFKKKEAYELTARSEADAEHLDSATLTEDQLRQNRYQAYLARQNVPRPDEFGAMPQRRTPKRYVSYDTQLTRVDESLRYDDPWDPATALDWGDQTTKTPKSADPLRASFESVAIDHEERPNSGYSLAPARERDSSYSTTPLLASSHQRDETRDSMIGVGTFKRGSVIDPSLR